MNGINNNMSKPTKKFSAGLINAVVWKNQQEFNGVMKDSFAVNIERRYVDKNNTWQSTGKLYPADIPKAILVLQEAFKFISLKDTTQAQPPVPQQPHAPVQQPTQQAPPQTAVNTAPQPAVQQQQAQPANGNVIA